MIQKIDEAVAFVRSRTTAPAAQVGIILGSGLGDVVDAIDVETAIPYCEIPGAKASTVLGHSGKHDLRPHRRAARSWSCSGRMHFYEGYEMAEVMFLARVIGRLGIKTLVVTNAAGGVNTSTRPAT